jgi:hypothetical protein
MVDLDSKYFMYTVGSRDNIQELDIFANEEI